MYPCSCATVHRDCLDAWMAYSNKGDHCEVCLEPYERESRTIDRFVFYADVIWRCFSGTMILLSMYGLAWGSSVCICGCMLPETLSSSLASYVLWQANPSTSAVQWTSGALVALGLYAPYAIYTAYTSGIPESHSRRHVRQQFRGPCISDGGPVSRPMHVYNRFYPSYYRRWRYTSTRSTEGGGGSSNQGRDGKRRTASSKRKSSGSLAVMLLALFVFVLACIGALAVILRVYIQLSHVVQDALFHSRRSLFQRRRIKNIRA